MLKENRIPKCPFCNGRVIYTECDYEIRQPDIVQCVGECFFEIMCDYEKGKSLEWYMNAFKHKKQ